MKKLLSLILLIATLLSMSGVMMQTVLANDIGENITWSYRSGVLTISGKGAMKDLSSPEAYPWHSNRSSVITLIIDEGITSVSDYAFAGCKSLYTLNLPSTLTHIGSHAFDSCFSIKEFTVPSSVTSLGDYAFYNCTQIRDLYIKASLEEIPEYAFADCKSINVLSLPTALKKVNAHAFDGCSGLMKLTLNSSLTDIGDYAFYNCKTLNNIELPSGLEHISASALINTGYYNDAENWIGDALYLDTRLVSVNADAAGELEIKQGTEYIAKKVFSDALGLESVLIPESVCYIEDNAFDGSNAVIKCYENSYTQNFALEKGIAYELIVVLSEPVFTEFGLQLTLSEIEDVAIIRTAYGDYDNEADIKRSETHRGFNAKNVLRGCYSYTVQYRNEGLVSVFVRYNDGHSFVYKFNITKKTPTFNVAGDTVKISDLSDLLVIRYAKGKYNSSAELKRAPDCTNISWKYFKDDIFSIKLDDGDHTFCVQYKDESYNLYNIKTDSSKPRIFCIGDSLTMGIETGWGDMVEVPYPERLEEFTGYITYNCGVGSDITEQIAMRAGSLPVFVKNITIPADTTPVALTPYLETGIRAQNFCYNGFAGVNDVEIAGVKGKLTDVNGRTDNHSNTRVYFTRNEPGEEVVITEMEQIITNTASSITSDDILIIWTGSNDLNEAEDTSYFEYLVEMQQDIIDMAGNKKFLIIGYTADNYLGVSGYTQCADQYNALMKEYWGEHFVDLKEYMATYQALEDFGIEPTSEDRYRLAMGWIPKSFLERGRNNIHFNQTGYDCVEYLIETRLYELGYIEK